MSELADQFGGGVRFIDGAEGIARRIAFLTQDHEFTRETPDFMVATGDPSGLSSLMPALETYGLAEIRPL